MTVLRAKRYYPERKENLFGRYSPLFIETDGSIVFFKKGAKGHNYIYKNKDGLWMVS